MRIRDLWYRWAGRRKRIATQAVIICVDVTQCRDAGIMSAEVDQLIAIVQKFMSLRRLGEYDGYECLPKETRIRLYSCDAPALAAAILPVLRALRVYECTTVRTSENVLGGDWRDVAR